MAKTPRKRAADPEQLAQVRLWVIEGASDAEIRAAIATAYPEANADALLIAAAATFKAAANFDPVTLTGWILESSREVYRRSLAAADHATALRCLKQIKDLVGGPAPTPDQDDGGLKAILDAMKQPQRKDD